MRRIRRTSKKEVVEVYLSKEAEKTYLKADHKKTRLLDNWFEHLEKSPLFGPNIKRLK